MTTGFPHIVYSCNKELFDPKSDVIAENPMDSLVEEVVRECRGISTNDVINIEEMADTLSPKNLLICDPAEKPKVKKIWGIGKLQRQPVKPMPVVPKFTPQGRGSILRSILTSPGQIQARRFQPFYQPAPLAIPSLPFHGLDAFGRSVICLPTTSLLSPLSPSAPLSPLSAPISPLSARSESSFKSVTKTDGKPGFNTGSLGNGRKRSKNGVQQSTNYVTKKRRFSLINEDVHMDHVDLLYKIIQSRKAKFQGDPFPATLKNLTECRLCGNCSFSTDPSTHWEFMKKHVYAHLPNGQSAFSCGLCGRSHVTCLSKVRSHIRKCHGEQYLSISCEAIRDHRESMDEYLVRVVEKCFGTEVDKCDSPGDFDEEIVVT